jgi:hypothetical protein
VSESRLEQQLRDLFERTRQANERYSSAEYRQPNQPAQSGMANRLDAYEEAMLMLARALDERGAR